MPSCPGERIRWAITFGERTEKVGPPPLVEGTRLPSQNSIAKGRSGNVRSISWRSLFVLASGTVHEPTAPSGATVPRGLEPWPGTWPGQVFEDGDRE